jgi:hypothetical protein
MHAQKLPGAQGQKLLRCDVSTVVNYYGTASSCAVARQTGSVVERDDSPGQVQALLDSLGPVIQLPKNATEFAKLLGGELARLECVCRTAWLYACYLAAG